MKLREYENVTQAFGSNAKFIDLSHIGLKGLVFQSASYKMSRYDEIHLGKFIASGVYRELFKQLHAELGHDVRILFEVEYSILFVNIIRKSNNQNIKLLKRFSIGLFYGRSLDELSICAKQGISNSLMALVNTEVVKVRQFMEMFNKQELQNKDGLEKSLEMFESISGEVLAQKDRHLIERYVYKNL